ncbi:MAG: hypothetical protein KDD85_05705 [Parvularculaceae bacterium]|nr:hypothetical protein [Parvularculaceae bacterium]
MARHSFSMRVIAARIAASIIGLVLFVYGLIAAFSPLPAGAPLVILGVLMIAAANPAARPYIRKMRRRWRWFDRLVRIVAKRGPASVKSVEEETAPEQRAEGGA